MVATCRFGVLGALAVALQGCVYISPDTLTNKQNCIDEDEDGVPRLPMTGADLEFECPGPARDCDDNDPERYPGSEEAPHVEIPYDHIDQDCDSFDIVDVDGDGYPGISRAVWEAIERTEGDVAEWPDGVKNGDTLFGAGADFDCDDDPAGDVATDTIPDAVDVNPGAKEAFGDGVDQDCACLDTKAVCDDYDSDGDGYVPDAFAKDSKLPAGDCDDTDPTVNPGVDNDDDTPYDGIDSNCDGLNDFDLDGDGFMPDAIGTFTETEWQEMFFQFCREYGYVDSKAGSDPDEYEDCFDGPKWGDCADEQASLPDATDPYEVNPDAVETWYDGVDSDCKRDNDYDADGDRYIDDTYADEYADYADFWDIYEDGCYEVTSETDSCTDGKDNNKDGRVDAADPACASGSVEWVLGVCAGSDCDDEDAEVHPNDTLDARAGTMELLGDGIDQDCEGGNDTTNWQYGGFGWNEPRNVVVGRNDRHFLLATGSTNTDATQFKNAGLVFLFDPELSIDDDPTDLQTFFNPTGTTIIQVLGPHVDMLTTPDGFYVGYSYTYEPTCTPVPPATTCTPSPPSSYLVAKRGVWEDASGRYNTSRFAYRQVTTFMETYPDVDMRFDGDGRVWVLGCGSRALAYAIGANVVTTTGTAYGTLSKGCYGEGACDPGTVAPTNPTQCFIDPPAAGQTIAKGVVCNGTTCSTYDMDPQFRPDGTQSTGTMAVSGTNPYSGLAYRETGVEWQNAYRAVIPSTGTGVRLQKDGSSEITVLSSYTVKAASAGEHGGRLYVAAVVADASGDGKDDVVVAYGATAALPTLTAAVMPLIITEEGEDFTFDPDQVGIYADADRVMIGVSGTQVGADCLSLGGTLCDVVAWAFLGPQG